MSDTSSKTVSMSKQQDKGRPKAGSGTPASTGSGGAPTKIPPPLTINLLCWALGLIVALNIVQAFLYLGWTDMLKASVITANANAKTPQDPFDAVHAVYQLRQGAFVQAALYGVMFALLIFAFRRTRSASASRWAVLIIFLFTYLPLRVIPPGGQPVPIQIASVAIGILAIAVLVLIFIPKESIAYFRECREANLPPERRGQPRPGLGSLFAPRPARTAGTAATLPGRTARPEPPRPAENRPAVPKAKAKVRTDSEAIAKGADLARARAKASKSRRTAG